MHKTFLHKIVRTIVNQAEQLRQLAREQKEREQKGEEKVEPLNDLHWLNGPFLPQERFPKRIGFDFQGKGAGCQVEPAHDVYIGEQFVGALF